MTMNVMWQSGWTEATGQTDLLEQTIGDVSWLPNSTYLDFGLLFVNIQVQET